MGCMEGLLELCLECSLYVCVCVYTVHILYMWVCVGGTGSRTAGGSIHYSPVAILNLF